MDRLFKYPACQSKRGGTAAPTGLQIETLHIHACLSSSLARKIARQQVWGTIRQLPITCERPLNYNVEGPNVPNLPHYGGYQPSRPCPYYQLVVAAGTKPCSFNALWTTARAGPNDTNNSIQQCDSQNHFAVQAGRSRQSLCSPFLYRNVLPHFQCNCWRYTRVT